MALASNTTIEGARFARDVRIDKLELSSFSSSRETVDLRYVTEQIDIYESMFEPKVSGNVVIRDGVNILSSMPVVGQEKLTFKWRTAGLPNWVEKEFFVYKISDRSYFPNHSQQYSLSFVSNEHKKNALVSVSKSFNAPYSEIVKSVLTDENYIKTTKNLDVEATKRSMEIVCPHWKPYALINWLSSVSVSAENESPSYMFFETLDGFVFRSIASMLPKPVKQQYIVQYQNLHHIPNNEQQWKDAFRSTEFYSVSTSFNTIDNILQGMFSSELLVYDLVSKKLTTTKYDYSKSFVDHPHLYPNKLYAERDKFEDNYVTNNQAYRNYMVTQGQIHSHPSYYPEEWRLQRQSYIRQLMTLPLTITVPGDSSMRCGGIIEFVFPSPEQPSEDGKVVEDKYLRGKYLVTSIHHIIKQDDYRMQLTLHKDSLFSQLALSDLSKLTSEKVLDTQVISV